MQLFGADKNSGMIRKNSDWFGMDFNPKVSPGILYGNSIESSQLEFYIEFQLELYMEIT